MSGVSLPVTRPTVGRALVVAHPSSRASLVTLLSRLGFDCAECDDPYTATLELTRRRLSYTALILSLSGLFREELLLVGTVKRRFPHLEIWLAHTDGRQGALAEAMRLGADGLLDDEGLHRIATPAMTQPAGVEQQQTYQPMQSASVAAALSVLRDEEQSKPGESMSAMSQSSESGLHDEQSGGLGEPVLSADELRALLQDPTDPAEKEA